MVKHFFAWNSRSEFSAQLYMESTSYCNNEESCSVCIILKTLYYCIVVLLYYYQFVLLYKHS